MRANLTAPALATWLVAGTIICMIWSVPWYVGVLGGLAAAAIAYWTLSTLEPKWDLIPEWGWRGLSAAFWAAIAIAWPSTDPSLELLKWLYALLAVGSLYDCIRGFLRRNPPKAPQA